MVQESFGVMSFPGINQIISGSYSLVHGISPGVAQLIIAPQLNFIGTGGDFIIAFDGVRIVLPDSRLDKHSFRRTLSGLTWRLDIFDRRWKWRFPTISGSYNLRDDGNNLIKDSEKTPQELAKLLLEAMGEKNFEVKNLPNITRPEVEWDFSNAASALASLCDLLGCRVVMHINSTVTLERTGIGKPLPLGNLSIADNSGSIDPPERPGKLKVVGGLTRFQVDFNLFPVGLDTDGTIKPIEELSYKPKSRNIGLATFSEGWPGIDPHNPFDEDFEDTLEAELAKMTVYRWYRIILEDHLFTRFVQPGKNALFELRTSEVFPGQFNEKFNSGPWEGELERLDQILPIEKVEIDTRNEFGIEVPKLAEVWGVWADGEMGEDTNVTDVLVPFDFTLGTDAFYKKAFTIDAKRGIVKFDEPLYSFVTDPNTGDKIPAEAHLALKIAVRFRDAKTRAFQRFELERKIGPDDTKAQIIKLPEIVLQRKTFFGDMDEFKTIINITDNKEDADKEANFHLDTTQKTLNEIKTPQSIGYNGIVAIDLDGAIQQVSWSVGSSGATTRASFNEEQEAVYRPYKVRRRNERLPAEFVDAATKIEKLEAEALEDG